MRNVFAWLFLAAFLAAPPPAHAATVTPAGTVDANGEHTAGIQAIVNEAQRTGDPTLYFEPGRYVVGTLKLNGSIRYIYGDGAVIVTRPKAGKWARCFEITYASDVDSKWVLVWGLEHVGNFEAQGTPLAKDIEQQAFVFGQATKKGRLNLLVTLCRGSDGAADFVCFYSRCNGVVDNCEVKMYRRGAVCTGGEDCRATIQNLVSSSASVKIEPGDANPVSVRMYDCQIGGRIALKLPGTSTCRLVNCTAGKVTFNDLDGHALDWNFPGRAINWSYSPSGLQLGFTARTDP